MKLLIKTGDEVADEILKQRTGTPLGYKKWVGVDELVKELKQIPTFQLDLKDGLHFDRIIKKLKGRLKE